MGELTAVRAATEQGDWGLALQLLSEIEAPVDAAEALELRAQATYGNGDFESSVAAWEELHTLQIEAGNPEDAALAASMVAMFLMMDTGLMAPVRGWLRRAELLLAESEVVPAHAIIAVVRGYERFMCGDMDAARQQSTLAIELGSQLGVDSVVMIGRVCSARVLIFDGEFEEGLDLLDGIAVDLMAGQVDPLTTGMMYCELICAAQGLALQDRAIEWTEVMDKWRPGGAIGAISGRCRVHRAELLRVSGPCDRAEEEALGACDELRPWMRREFGWPLVELGNIRLRKGDLSGAEEAFVSAHERAWSPHPGLALLRLAQGDAATATAMIKDAIANPFEIPSKERPPFGDLSLAPLFEAQAEIASATNDVEAVTAAAASLRSIADSYPSKSLEASAALASARAALITGDSKKAIHDAAAATAAWADIGAPFETAVARMVLAESRHRSEDIEGARMDWSAARKAFENYGATLWATRAAQLLEDPAARSTPTYPTQISEATATATFRCEGDTRTISYGGQSVLMRDLKGFRYIERLLADPGREFHVLDLVAIESGTATSAPARDQDNETTTMDFGGGLAVIDDEAREAYRRRLAEVEDDIEDATAMNDIGRADLARRDREYLVAELASAVGLGGRSRTVGGTAERARTSVTRSLRYALGRLAEHHSALATHLEQSVRTGTYCVYSPDPLVTIEWDVA
ncbi:MAG: hypothetical protein DRJ50_04105 [Actinobacteria bacterium]|nr:MAG: hypothetical protein DRJ50_04105 [Actinomycetota bacterium]